MYKLLGLLFVSSSMYPAASLLMRSVRGANIAKVFSVEKRCLLSHKVSSDQTIKDQMIVDQVIESRSEVFKFVESLRKEITKIDQAVVSKLRHKGFSKAQLNRLMPDAKTLDWSERYRRERKIVWHTYEKFRILAAAELFGKDYVNICDAVKMEDHEVLQRLLECGADPNAEKNPHAEYSDSAIEIAMEHNDLISLKILLAAGARVYTIKNISGMSCAMFQVLLVAGCRERDPWDHQSYVRDLFPRYGACLDDADKRELLKKMMLAVNSGASADPYVGNGSCLVRTFRAKDWEAFPDLVKYLRAANTLQSVRIHKRASSTILRIMRDYRIEKEDVAIDGCWMPRCFKDDESRLQDSE
jgi:hypothetical protein